MRIRQSMRRTHRRNRGDGANWLSFSDLMSSLLLMFILIMFYIMYQYFDMYEVNMAEIARQQFDLDQANASLDEKTAKLTLAEQQMIAQQVKLEAAQKELTDAQTVLEKQKAALTTAQTLLGEKEKEIAAQQTSLDQLGARLDEQQAQIQVQQDTLTKQRATMTEQQTTMDAQREKLETLQKTLNEQQAQIQVQQDTLTKQQTTLKAQQTTMDEQREKLEAQQTTMSAQQTRLQEQQEALEAQQVQIEQLVGLRTRIISALSEALRAAKVSAQVDPTSGSIALKSDVLFDTNEYELTDKGKAFIDRFLPVYLKVLLSDDYRAYVSEIIIEGHTDTVGGYIANLKLSQRRALAVASYVLDDEYSKITSAQKRALRSLVTANGRSWSDPVRDAAGNVDLDASRRVVFKFRMTDEQMIQQLKDIMEKADN